MAVLTAPKITQMFETGELAPKGTYIVTCVDIKDLFGVERRKFQSEEIEKVNLTAFLFGFRDKQGKPFKVASRSFRISGNEKSNLFAFLKAWLGEAPKMGWDYMEMKGKKALLTVEHIPSAKNPSQIYGGIASISPVPEGYQIPPSAPAQPQAAPAPAAAPATEDEGDELPF